MQRVVLVVSGVLLTLGLLAPAPSMWSVAGTLCAVHPWTSSTLYRYHDFLAPTGFGSLAVIAIGLIVTWAGYVKGVRWTWLVLLVITWVWAFPVMILPLAHPWMAIVLTPLTLWHAVTLGGLSWTFAKISGPFFLLALGLVLPVPMFIRGRRAPQRDGNRVGTQSLGFRRDVVALSGILFTAALLMLAPAMWKAAATVHHQGNIWGAGPQTRFQYGFAPAGFTSLAVIAVGLIVTWAAYIKRVRWTWFVLLVIVWVWAFPVLVLPYLRPWKDVPTVAQSFASFISEGGPLRNFLEVLVAFALMLLALVLPAKTFLLRRRGDAGAAGHPNPGAEGSST
jgi:hypothetical protein